MKLAFIINSLNSYRHLAPLIKGGLERGYAVECWLNHSIEKNGSKGYLFPDIARSPYSTARYPNLKNLTFENKSDMQTAMIARKDVSFFVSQYYPEIEMDIDQLQRFTGTWCTIMHVHDSFLEMKRIKVEELRPGIKKLFFPYSTHFFDLGMQYFDGMLKSGKSYFANPDTEVHPIGCPMVGPELLHIDKNTVRQKFGIPDGRNILLYLPYPYNFNDAKGYKGTYAWQAAFAGMHIGRKASKGFRNNALVTTPLTKRIGKQLSYLRKVLADGHARQWMFNGWNEPGVVDSIRKFCDRNNLLFVVKPRIKFPFSDAAYEKADLIIEDDESQYFPSKLQELFAVCDLAIGYSTTAVYESVYCNVPYVNLRYPDGLEMNPHRKFWNFTTDGTPFYFTGAAWDTMIPDFIRDFRSARLEDYRMDQVRRKEYMQLFTGVESPSVADNFYTVLECKSEAGS